MTSTTQKLSKTIDVAIPVFILLQTATVSISIAISSIMFTTWLILWLIQVLFDRHRALSVFTLSELRFINIFVILYFIAEVVSRVFAVYPEGAFDNLKRLLLFSVFYGSVAKITGYVMITRMLAALVSIIAVISSIELITYIIKFGEMISRMPFAEIRIDYFNYPLTIAEIKMMVLLSVIPLLLASGGFPVKKSYMIMMIIPIIVSMLLTQSRNVYLAFFICLILYGIFVNRKFLLTLIAVSILGLLLLPSSMSERMKSILDTEHPSNKSRIVMWQTGWKMFLDHPVTGVADNKILEIYSQYKTPEYHSEGVHLHNNFMMILATTGVIGFIAFSGLFIALISGLIRLMKIFDDQNKKLLTQGSLLVVVSFLIAGVFEWSFGDHEVMTVFFFLLSVPFILAKEEKTDKANELLDR